MKSHRNVEYRKAYSQNFENVCQACKESSEESSDIPRFIQKMWEKGFKIEPHKADIRKYSFHESISIFETLVQKTISDYHKAKIFDILRDCQELRD